MKRHFCDENKTKFAVVFPKSWSNMQQSALTHKNRGTAYLYLQYLLRNIENNHKRNICVHVIVERKKLDMCFKKYVGFENLKSHPK